MRFSTVDKTVRARLGCMFSLERFGARRFETWVIRGPLGTPLVVKHSGEDILSWLEKVHSQRSQTGVPEPAREANDKGGAE